MPGKTTSTPRITKFTNCRLVRGSSLVEQDLWIDSLTGKILKDQEAFYELHLSPDEIIDLGGRIVAPGMIDVQLNGAHGFDFSVPCDTKEEYDEGLRMVNRGLARTGVTSYLPTVVSSTPEVYWKVSKHQPNPKQPDSNNRLSLALSPGPPLPWTNRRKTPTTRWRRIPWCPRRRPIHQPRPQRDPQDRSAPRSANLPRPPPLLWGRTT